MTIPTNLVALCRTATWRALSSFMLLQTYATYGIGRLCFWIYRLPQTTDPLDIDSIESVLVVRLDEIGDGVMFTPFLRELRRLLPAARITLVVKPVIRNLVETCPYVTEVFTYNPEVQHWLRPFVLPARALIFAWARLWKAPYDLAIQPRWETDSCYASYVAFFSGARWRAAFSENTTRRRRQLNHGFDALFTSVLDDRDVKHQTEHNLDLIAFLGGRPESDRQELWMEPADREHAAKILTESGSDGSEILVGFGLSGGHNPLGRQWSIENFIELGRRMQADYGARPVIVGAAGDTVLGRQIQEALGPCVINAVGRTSLREMAALLARCDAYVGNDSGPMHVAAAVGPAVVAIFGSTCWHRSRPRGVRTDIVWNELPCSPCNQDHGRDQCSKCVYQKPLCIGEIPVDRVYFALRKTLDDVTGRTTTGPASLAELVFHAAVPSGKGVNRVREPA